MRCHISTSWHPDSWMWQLERDTSHVPAGVVYPRGGRLEMEQDPEGQSSGYGMTSLQTVPHANLEVWGIVLLEEKIVSYIYDILAGHVCEGLHPHSVGLYVCPELHVKWTITLQYYSNLSVAFFFLAWVYNMGLDARKPPSVGLRTTQAQISLRMRAVWSAPLLFALRKVPYVDISISAEKTVLKLALSETPKTGFLAMRPIWASTRENLILFHSIYKFCFSIYQRTG